MTDIQAAEPQEIELKFELVCNRVEELAEHPALAELGCEERQLEAVYFDTPRHDLREAGFSLRVRRDGSRFVQSVKRGGSTAGLFDRSEWEQDVQGPLPDGEALAAVPLPGKRRRLRDMQPVAEVKVRRRIWIIEQANGRIEVALDQGRIVADSRDVPICELELELKGGSPASLFDFAKAICETVPLRLSACSKAERGYRLATGEQDKVQKAAPLHLTPGMSVAAAFSAVTFACLAHFRLNEPLIGSSPDALHQARVAMRRLRAAFSLFRRVVADDRYPHLREELRWFTGSLGEARDLDVFTKRYGDALAPGDGERLAQARTAAYGRVLSALDSLRLRTLLLDLSAWVAAGAWRASPDATKAVERFAAKRLGKLWGTVRSGGAQLLELDEHDRHQVRIDVKKVRYAIEFLGGLYDARRVREFTKSLATVQEALGEMNDQVAARETAARLSLPIELPPGDGSHKKELKRIAKRFAGLDQTRPFWKS